jgi:DNA replication protein DnaC
MNTKATVQQLQQLRLPAMVKHYDYVLTLPIHQQPEAHELLAELAEQEMYHRQNRKTELLFSASKLRMRSYVNQITFEQERNLKEQHIIQLAEGNYINKAENILITGATGCGKTYIACALGNQACQQGCTVLYYNMNKLADKIVMSKLDGSYNKLYKQLITSKLLLLDDFGLAPMTYETKLTLLQIIEERYELKATIIVAQIPVSNWYDYINEPTIADAILDRLTAKAHRIELKGQSKRMKINQ